jgi:hypothetical protein
MQSRNEGEARLKVVRGSARVARSWRTPFYLQALSP